MCVDCLCILRRNDIRLVLLLNTHIFGIAYNNHYAGRHVLNHCLKLDLNFAAQGILRGAYLTSSLAVV